MLSQAKEEKMMRLTDSQLMLLSKAAERDDGAAVFPDRMKKAAAMKVASSLVTRKLMREIRTKPAMPVWREEEDGRRISLIITRAGRDAIGVADHGSAAEPPAATSNHPTVAEDAEHPSASILPRTGSKQALVVAMLSKDKGVTLDDLVAATGWLPHTTRAALTGLRRRGFVVERTRHETKGSLYRIAGDPNGLVRA
jgi:Protein of unknown function (DUF3489)